MVMLSSFSHMDKQFFEIEDNKLFIINMKCKMR